MHAQGAGADLGISLFHLAQRHVGHMTAAACAKLGGAVFRRTLGYASSCPSFSSSVALIYHISALMERIYLKIRIFNALYKTMSLQKVSKPLSCPQPSH